MVEERLYIVTYDIADDRRWRRVFKLMHGYGRRLQLSVFQCRLSAQRRAELARRLEAVIHDRDNYVLILDLGPADKVDPRVESLGKSFEAVTRAAVLIQCNRRTGLVRRIHVSAVVARIGPAARAGGNLPANRVVV
jgi:CRISPR-associated protein Cas2